MRRELNSISRSHISSSVCCLIIIAMTWGDSNVEETFHYFRVETVCFSAFMRMIAPRYSTITGAN
jgi:hypothetical protein